MQFSFKLHKKTACNYMHHHSNQNQGGIGGFFDEGKYYPSTKPIPRRLSIPVLNVLHQMKLNFSFQIFIFLL